MLWGHNCKWYGSSSPQLSPALSLTGKGTDKLTAFSMQCLISEQACWSTLDLTSNSSSWTCSNKQHPVSVHDDTEPEMTWICFTIDVLLKTTQNTRPAMGISWNETMIVHIPLVILTCSSILHVSPGNCCCSCLCSWIMASLTRSAALPWQIVLTAWRSAWELLPVEYSTAFS